MISNLIPKDLPKMIRIMAEFVGRSLSEEVVQRIAKHCSFDEMRTNNMVNRENLPIKDLFDMTETKFMRKGIIGDWKNHFTEEQSRLFDNIYNDKLRAIGLDLCYDAEEAKQRMQTFGRIIDQNFDNEINCNDKFTKHKHNSSEISKDGVNGGKDVKAEEE